MMRGVKDGAGGVSSGAGGTASVGLSITSSSRKIPTRQCAAAAAARGVACTHVW